MPFGLKNAGVTYQRMVTQIFKDKIDKFVKVYINDMVVKTKGIEGHTSDLAEVFDVLRQHQSQCWEMFLQSKIQQVLDRKSVV